MILTRSPLNAQLSKIIRSSMTSRGVTKSPPKLFTKSISKAMASDENGNDRMELQ